MDWKEFIASIVSSLAWPAVVVSILYVLRAPIGDAVMRLTEGMKLRSFKAGPGGVEGTLEAAEKKADAAGLPSADDPKVAEVDLLPPPKQVVEPPVDRGPFEELALRSPEAAVLGAWRGVEEELRAVGVRAGLKLPSRLPGMPVAHRLHEGGYLPAELFGLVRDLSGVRNSVAHADLESVTSLTANEYIDLARRVVSALRELPT